jgi:hypothetical protein
MKILRIFFLFSCGELCEAVYEAEKQMNVVIIMNSLSNHDIKFFGSNFFVEKHHMKNVLKMQGFNQ